MHPLVRIAFAALAVTLAMQTQAKTAAEVFESVSNSVVVVHGLDAKGEPVVQGSGVILPDGAVVTNCHVVEKSNRFEVKHQGRSYPASLKHADHDRDVCSLSVAGLKAPAARPGTTKTLKVGQRVYAIGAPSGLELTLSEGIVSSLREVEGGRYIQTTAPISPGSSGGGLFDDEGRLIGLPTFYLKEGQQLNFAVPVEWIAELPERHTGKAKSDKRGTDWLNESIALQESQDWPAMERHARRWTQAQPRNSAAWFSLGIANARVGQPAKAIEAYQQALRINPKDDGAWNNLGFDYDKVGQLAKAIEAFQKALRINLENAVAWNNLGSTYGKAGQTAKGIEAFQKALRINPEYASAWYNLGIAYKNNDQTAKAIEAYQQSIRINPEDEETWNNLGTAYNKVGQTAKAIEAFQQAIRINPENADAGYNLGVAYKNNGQHSRVMEIYRHLKMVAPQRADEFFTKIVLP